MPACSQVCNADFNRVTKRKHVCKKCSHAVCDAHATKTLMRVTEEVTVCEPCKEYVERVVKVVDPTVSLKAPETPSRAKSIVRLLKK